MTTTLLTSSNAAEHTIECRCREYQREGYDSVPPVSTYRLLWRVALAGANMTWLAPWSVRPLRHALEALFATEADDA